MSFVFSIFYSWYCLSVLCKEFLTYANSLIRYSIFFCKLCRWFLNSLTMTNALCTSSSFFLSSSVCTVFFVFSASILRSLFSSLLVSSFFYVSANSIFALSFSFRLTSILKLPCTSVSRQIINSICCSKCLFSIAILSGSV